MLVRLGLVALGLVELLFPRRTVDFWMDLAVAGGERVELRPWVYAVARLEGVVVLLWVLSQVGGEERDVRDRVEP